MSKFTDITDALPGGEKRIEQRAVIKAAKGETKKAKVAETTAKMTEHPIRTKLIWGATGAFVITLLVVLNQTGGDEVLGEAAGETANRSVGAGVSAGGAVLNIGGGGASGAIDRVSDEIEGRNIEFGSPVDIGTDNPTFPVVVQGDDEVVSATTQPTQPPVSPSGPEQYTVKAGDSDAVIGGICLGDPSASFTIRNDYYRDSVQPINPVLADKPDPGEIVICP